MTSQPTATPVETLPEAAWGPLIPEEQWRAFVDGALAIQAAAVPFVLHGAFALAAYTERWRNTKDVDIIVRESDHEPAIAALLRAGFTDYHDRAPYDRSWIFRGTRDGVIFDIIWSLPNHRVVFDDAWFQRATPLWLRGRLFAIAPVEEVIRVKLYVFQRERCDWVDVVNLLAAAAGRIEWRWLVERMGADLPLLHGALAVFNWLSPQRAQALPAWLRQQFALPPIDGGDLAAVEREHVALLDARPWFALHQPRERLLER